ICDRPAEGIGLACTCLRRYGFVRGSPVRSNLFGLSGRRPAADDGEIEHSPSRPLAVACAFRYAGRSVLAASGQFVQRLALNRTWELADRYRRPSNQKRVDCWTESGSVYSACQVQKVCVLWELYFIGTGDQRGGR